MRLSSNKNGTVADDGSAPLIEGDVTAPLMSGTGGV
jgi:hypothetical protein